MIGSAFPHCCGICNQGRVTCQTPNMCSGRIQPITEAELDAINARRKRDTDKAVEVIMARRAENAHQVHSLDYRPTARPAVPGWPVRLWLAVKRAVF